MTEKQAIQTSWHEAGHCVVSLHYGIPAFPVVNYKPHTAEEFAGVCHLDKNIKPTKAQERAIGWAGILAQGLKGFREDWMPPLKPTARNLGEWHSFMWVLLDNLSRTDQQLIGISLTDSLEACRKAYKILKDKKNQHSFKRIAEMLIADARQHMPKPGVAASADQRVPIETRATFLKDYLAWMKPDAPDRAKLEKILEHLQRGEEPPARP